jgi:heme-degrading monooxygenase HmoA
MAEVVTIVSGTVPHDREREVIDPYREALEAGLPPGIERTSLLRANGGDLAILTVWRRRADLEAMLATGEEPLARRLIREAGGSPEVRMYEIVADTSSLGQP